MEAAEIVGLINAEMCLATGCTEPAAVALAAAAASQWLRKEGEEPENIEVAASINIIKNAMAAGIPGSHYTGMKYAAAIGAMSVPDYGLEVFDYVSKEKIAYAEEMVKKDAVIVKVADVSELLYIDVEVRGKKHRARAIISGQHENIVRIELDDETVFQKNEEGESSGSDNLIDKAKKELSLERVFEFAVHEFLPYSSQGDMIRKSVQVNEEIAQEGLKNQYGLGVGRLLARNQNSSNGANWSACAVISAAAGADARMAGAPLPVVTNSGSGNQGITATVPVVAVAKSLNKDEETMLRAVALSNLVAIYIKLKFGRLSALCGASVAGTGAACGITYLLGGGFQEICFAIQNMAGNITGMLCDGAKSDCSLKIVTAIQAATQAALMAVNGISVPFTDGIVEKKAQDTIENIATLSQKCSRTLDQTILEMMIHKDGM